VDFEAWCVGGVSLLVTADRENNNAVEIPNRLLTLVSGVNPPGGSQLAAK
jgi:hypothetical protein